MKKQIETVSKGKTKICGICLLGIDESKEFAELIHYLSKNKVKGKDYYHISCYRNRIGMNQEYLKLAGIASQTLIDAREKLGLRC
jgi:hypothetical protein